MSTIDSRRQAIIKYLNGDKVIGDSANKILKKAEEEKNVIIIPSAVIFEIGYLYKKLSNSFSVTDIKDIVSNPINILKKNYLIGIIKSAFEMADIPEPHNWLIAGTARYLDLLLITNDSVILKSSFAECVK